MAKILKNIKFTEYIIISSDISDIINDISDISGTISNDVNESLSQISLSVNNLELSVGGISGIVDNLELSVGGISGIVDNLELSVGGISGIISGIIDTSFSNISTEISNKIWIDDRVDHNVNGATNLSIIKLSREEYDANVCLKTTPLCANVLYVLDSDYLDAYGQVIDNLQMTVDSNPTEATNKHFVDTNFIHISGDSDIGTLELTGNLIVGSRSNKLGDKAHYCLIVGDTDMSANGDEAVAIGYKSTAAGNQAISFGSRTTASADYAFAQGEKTIAGGKWSCAQGEGSKALNDSSHAEGFETEASGLQSHAEGKWTIAGGTNSFAGGYYSKSFGDTAYAIGHYAITSADYSYVWSGDESTHEYIIPASMSGTYNINPKNGLSGFYIGDKNLSAIIDETIDAKILETLGPINDGLETILNGNIK